MRIRSLSSKLFESKDTGLQALNGSYGTIWSFHASIVSVHGPPRRQLEPLNFLNFYMNADPDPDFHHIADPDPTSQIIRLNVDPDPLLCFCWEDLRNRKDKLTWMLGVAVSAL